MDFWFQFAISIVKGVLAGLHLDPTKATTLKAVLLGVANDIYILYGMTPPAPPAV
jgi:hypothetical protein